MLLQDLIMCICILGYNLTLSIGENKIKLRFENVIVMKILLIIYKSKRGKLFSQLVVLLNLRMNVCTLCLQKTGVVGTLLTLM